METLSVGMYVKTLNGIVKIDKIKDSIMIDTKGKTHFGDFIKASYNIIDILEVGDIISFYEDIDNYKKQYVIGIPDLITLDEIKDKITNDNIRLVSILTKEQMEQMAYKVGD